MLTRRRRIVVAAGAALATLGIGATSVSAMDCFVVNRAVQGAYGAAHSSQWVLLDVNALLVGAGACQAAIDQVDAAMTAAGFPLVVVSRSDKTLPENGHGILHLDDPGGFFDTLINAAEAAIGGGACG
ncbi:MAG TPA: hypothetical protein VFC09_02280 [Candidatus Dormibacteraeota bacterium]|nr:hypothetical protein [Candidatus Dormibacteraeota bacterium]